MDNDGDRSTDCDDPDCLEDRDCDAHVERDCDDGEDNDGDRSTDCGHPLGETQTGLDIFFDETLLDLCPAADGNDNAAVSPGEVQTSLDNFFEDCPVP